MLNGQRGPLTDNLTAAPDFVRQGVYPGFRAAAAVVGGDHGQRFEPTVRQIAIHPGNLPSTCLSRQLSLQIPAQRIVIDNAPFG